MLLTQKLEKVETSNKPPIKSGPISEIGCLANSAAFERWNREILGYCYCSLIYNHIASISQPKGTYENWLMSVTRENAGINTVQIRY